MANYLLAGAAGFIGFRVAQMLMDAGHSVSGVDNLNDAYDVRMKDHRLSLIRAYPNFCFYHIDISQREAMDKMFTERYEHSKQPPFDAVINLAARAGVRQSLENPWVYMDTNITGTLNLLELCRRYGIQKFVLASTSSIYGGDAPLPTPEEANSSQPLQPYAASKKGAEVLSYSYHFLYGIDVTVFRYFTVYGPAARPDMVMFRFTQWISEGRPVKVNGDGEQSRGFTYLDDIAKGTILGLKPLGYEVINLGGHQVIKINELITMIENLSGRKAQVEHFPRHPADMFANWASIDKAKRLLGWQPQVGLEKGVLNLVNWYNAERSWASLIETN